MSDWHNKRIMITGSEGFLGRYVVAELKQRGTQHIFIPRHQAYNLTQLADVERVYKDSLSDIVIHLAAKVGSIGIPE